MIAGDKAWSLLKVNAQKQRGYCELLKEYYPGIEAYYPMYSRLCRQSGMRRAKEVKRPVYPGYVFVMVGGDLHGPVSLPVRASWVRFGGVIEHIPEVVIAGLREMEENNELVREVKYVDPYVPGARVLVRLPVQDLAAVIVKLVGKNRAVVETGLCRATVPINRLKII